ncbi:PAS domain-containing hybrid sensor histidine kinase/response regulator [Piscinibacter sp.]|uniref:PAS domain-containing hybrid sensor histidine kinase/response regulator n=1 Tax=Piscinibacter sp. TaxID=1903157 RepID=UPI002D1BC721|nr:PAS domain S-box protein [Albitalea sp.]HUG25082.1 PAS domain S-box protein [Albitalea sp.]
MTVLQASVAAFSIHLLSAVRAYVTGESLYSKGQKDAQIYLLEYAEKHREADYERFMAALAVPLGDRAAREALQQAQPDVEKAKRGFLDGGNHPDDIPGLIRLFRWFQHVPFMAKPIATWTEGDRVIQQMLDLVGRARERILAGDPWHPAVEEMRVQAPVLNERLTRLENAFSFQLGEASRTTQEVLLGLNASIAVLLTITGLGFVRRSALVQASMEAEVIHRQESLQRLLDSVAEGLYGVDVEGRCTFINKAALTMLGYAHESDLLGRDIHAVIHHSRADGRPYPASESNVYHAYRARQASHSVDEVFWRRDGSAFPVEYWSHPILHNDEVQGAVATFFDISDRVEMQAALRRGELRMERLIDAVTDGVVTIDADRKVVLFNRAAESMFGTRAADALGSPIDRFFADGPIDANSMNRGADAVDGVDAPIGRLRELVGRRQDGQEFPVEASLSRLDTERGVLTTVVLRDVTALHVANAEKRAREALEAANQAKTEFLSRMSHELRTPLNAVIGFAQLLRLDVSKPLSFEQLERVQHVESAGAHLLALVNDVLDLSRIESGEMFVAQEAIPLSMAVEEATTMVSPLVTEAGVEVFVSPGNAIAGFQSEDVWVEADRVRLRQVLVNLLSNAVKYNKRGGSVTLSSKTTDGQCEIRVVDTGQGIPADKLAGLFQPFNRLGAEDSTVDGTGIGLVLSRQLAEMMGGSLEITSTFSQGTTASLTLRIAQRPVTSPTLPSAPEQPQTLARRPLNVLYAEDNEVNAELVRQVVNLRPGVSLRVAENGTVALEMARFDPPDLLLVDMNLGDMTGIELARALHRDRATRSVRLVALSADALPEQIEAALRCGFEGYLTKPINFPELLAVLDQHSQDALA